MSGDNFARDYFREALERLAVVRILLDRGSHPSVIRESQEILELVLKGLIRWAGADPPRIHDPSPALEPLLGRLPPAWRDSYADLRALSAWLAEARGPAFYGDEEDDRPASEIFGRSDAERALADVERFVGLYGELFR